MTNLLQKVVFRVKIAPGPRPLQTSRQNKYFLRGLGGYFPEKKHFPENLHFFMEIMIFEKVQKVDEN